MQDFTSETPWHDPSSDMDAHKSSNRKARRPAALWIFSILVASIVVLTPVYLLIRTFGAAEEAVDQLLRMRILWIILRSLLLVFFVTLCSVLIAVPVAWLTVKTDLAARKLWAVLTMLPLVIPSYVAGFLYIIALGPKGALQTILEPLGVDRIPSIYGFTGALFTLTILSYPYVLLPVRAALTRMDPSIEEASRSLGKKPWDTFKKVTLPQLIPSIFAGALLVGLYTLSDFGAVSLMQYESFTWAIFIQYESALNASIASFLSCVLIVFALLILLVDSAAKGEVRYYRTNPGAQRGIARSRLGRWHLPAQLFLITLTGLALILPASVLIYWLARGIGMGEQGLFLWKAMGNSLYISALATILTVSVSIPVATLMVRHRSKATELLSKVTYLGFGLPGITVALGFVFFSIRYAPIVYQTIGLLVVAYLVLHIAGALRPMRASLLQVNPRHEEAARSLGRTQKQAFISVTLPRLKAGIIASSALIFLLTMKELPATLILAPPGFNTLATSIWSSASEAFFAQAAASSLLLIAAASVPMGILLLRERNTR